MIACTCIPVEALDVRPIKLEASLNADLPDPGTNDQSESAAQIDLEEDDDCMAESVLIVNPHSPYKVVETELEFQGHIPELTPPPPECL